MGKRCTFRVRVSRNFVDGDPTARTCKRATLTYGEKRKKREHENVMVMRNFVIDKR